MTGAPLISPAELAVALDVVTVLDVRYVAVAGGESLTVSDESDDVRWFDVDALPEDAEPALREAIALACERVRANPGL